MNQPPKLKIYLAGGFNSGWQIQARHELINFEIFDPSSHAIQDPKAYTEWDLNAIEQSDIVLANMEHTNPGGYSLALEVGFAKALSKRIILVDQVVDAQIKKYFEMVRQCSDVVVTNLPAALSLLNSY
ncbi:nucleoside 2-deoxyribosyltransferase domain-containing protein [Paraburkholderia madseniana]|uniref:nucleoside 2-deoxyribosyltransferase domain-containing protein n=1 Tax=Paraburkholderia madseniana TaxID=2599607 RepID=UPI0038B8E575